jgi:chromosome segregation ATPase
MAGQPEGNELRRELGRLRERVTRLEIDLAERINQARTLQQEVIALEQALQQRAEQAAIIQAELYAARYAWWDNDRERLRTYIENVLGVLERDNETLER